MLKQGTITVDITGLEQPICLPKTPTNLSLFPNGTITASALSDRDLKRIAEIWKHAFIANARGKNPDLKQMKGARLQQRPSIRRF